jgi:hypothetical protein
MKTVIEMAREAGFQVDQGALLRIYLERFAALVAQEATEEANRRANASWTLMCEKMVAAEREAWKWHQAPVKTSWGHDMVVADLAIDKDNTVSVYCERDQTTKVEAMFSTPPAAEKNT